MSQAKLEQINKEVFKLLLTIRSTGLYDKLNAVEKKAFEAQVVAAEENEKKARRGWSSCYNCTLLWPKYKLIL